MRQLLSSFQSGSRVKLIKENVFASSEPISSSASGWSSPISTLASSSSTTSQNGESEVDQRKMFSSPSGCDRGGSLLTSYFFSRNVLKVLRHQRLCKIKRWITEGFLWSDICIAYIDASLFYANQRRLPLHYKGKLYKFEFSKTSIILWRENSCVETGVHFHLLLFAQGIAAPVSQQWKIANTHTAVLNLRFENTVTKIPKCLTAWWSSMLIALIVWHKGRKGNRDRKGRGGKVWRQIVQYRGGTLGKQWNSSPFY